MGLVDIPLEVLTQILEYVEGTDLAQLCGVNRTLWRSIVEQEPLWKLKCTNELGTDTYEPYKSWYDQYCALWRHKWLRPSLWHGDKNVFGTLAVSLYNKSLGAFEVYEVILSRASTGNNEHNHMFELVIDQTVDPSVESDTLIRIVGDDGVTAEEAVIGQHQRPHFYIGFAQSPIIRVGRQTDYDDEASLTLFDGTRQLFTHLMRAAAISQDRQHRSMSLWPPKMLPAKTRARNVSGTGFRGHYNKKTMTACEDLFRVRRWVTYMHSPFNLVMGETVETYSRVLEEWYHSTSNSSLQGVWVAHLPNGLQAILVRELENGRRLEATKLTGDIDVPRGEYFFISDDVWAKPEQQETHLPEFVYRENMTVIRAVYQAAEMNFMNNSYFNGGLLLCSKGTAILYQENGSYMGHMYKTNLSPLMRSKS